MPRGKHLSPEQIAEIVGLYEIGVTGPDIARKTGVAWSTVVKLIVRELGLVGSPDRPIRRPPANKYNFTDEKRAELVELYRGGLALDECAAHFHADQDKIKEELGVAGEPIRPTGRPRVVAPEVHCPVCGELIAARRFFYGADGVAVPPKSCGKDECESAIAFGLAEARPPIPRADIRRDKGGWTPESKARAVQREELEKALLAERLPVDLDQLAQALTIEQIGEYGALFELTEDSRGINRPGAQGAIWGDLSRVPVYMRLVARGEGHAAIRLILRPGETVFDRFVEKFFPSKEQLLAVSSAFRPLLAWRCVCPQGSSWMLDTVVDLPEEPGVYGVCPLCGACALHVDRED